MKPPPEVVELAEYDVVVREFADLYYIVRQSVLEGMSKCGVELEAVGIDEQVALAAQASIDAELGRILKDFAAGLRLPPKAEIGFEPKEGVEYRINNDMSELRKTALEALRPPPDGDSSVSDALGSRP